MQPALGRETFALMVVSIAEGVSVSDTVSLAVAVAVIMRIAIAQTTTRTCRQGARRTGLEVGAEIPGATRRLTWAGRGAELRYLVLLRGCEVARRRPVARVAEVARI